VKKKNINIDKAKKNLVSCPKCGFENTKHLKNCLSCGEKLAGAKSCPRCAKINLKNAKTCVNCGFKFYKSKKATIASLLFSSVLLLILSLLLLFGQKEVVKDFLTGFRWIAVLIIVLIVVSTFTYGRKEKIDYDSHNEARKYDLIFKKLIAKIAIVIGLVIAAIFIYCTFFTGK